MSRQTRKFTDLDIAFLSHPTTGDVTKRYDESAIKQSIVNLIMTNFQERLFHPEIGSHVQAMLFEPFTELTRGMMIKAITETVVNYEPRAQLIDVIVKDFPDNNELRVTIIFKIVNTSEPYNLDLILKRTR